ncbi:NUDIX hydrolase [Beutenbergia cavernae DSM 12333]|uniref:NUDIX hydrolase n=1 Tax=Beutenbergia cavernae (strain ATCC BAA-8 / DSM 12333 / CCUG 43141 / JCM 11478 / NBRC 16432 / NCIMB 13614 / HKI 0122) TaxID=471853 RepID=C5BXU4_BEUC1|nr:NUDIX domain-containing protein [Beutenbergia cavernae]ACQ78838.1 NUDIX hydrolase [Beutenbergia cavernae DSM 12333]
MPVPEYVARLRAAVGHELLWLPGVSAVVTDPADRVLLGRRTDNGLWAIPGGILDPGEEPAVGLRREILEETGVLARTEALVLVDTTDVVHYASGDSAQYLNLTFWCVATGGEAHVADDESTAVGWFARDALPEPLAASTSKRVAAYDRYRADPANGPDFVP